MRTIIPGLAWGLCVAVGLSSCSTDMPEFTGADVCGVGSELVADVLGTEAFEAGSDRRSTMPFDGSVSLDNLEGYEPSSSCSIRSDDGRLLLMGEIVDVGDVEVQQKTLRQFGDTFDHAGGVGGINEGTAGWACGQIRVLVKSSGDIDPSPSALQAATEAFADVTGCWSGEAS